MGSLVAGWGKGCTCDFSGVLAQSWAMVPTSLLRKSLIQDSRLGNRVYRASCTSGVPQRKGALELTMSPTNSREQKAQ